MSQLMFSISGVRGVMGESLTPIELTRFASAFGTFVGEAKTVVVARDTRRSGEQIKHSIFGALMATGCNLIDIGICPTPTALLVTKLLKADGCCVITASHNPIGWNGLEFASKFGRLMSSSEREEFLDIYKSGSFDFVPEMEQGSMESDNSAIGRHIDAILNCDWIELEVVKDRALKVAIDCVNGAGSEISPKLLRLMGCEVVELNCVPDGNFPRASEPTPESLHALSEIVSSKNLDFGLAHDGDADRLVIVTNTGEVLGGEHTLALLADFMLDRRKGDLVTSISTSHILEHVAEKHNRSVYRTAVGVGFIAEKMSEVDAVLGGESTGGVIFPELQLTTDAIVSLAAIVQLAANSDRSIATLVSEFPNLIMCKKKLEVSSREVAKSALGFLSEHFGGGTLDRTDGIKYIWENDRWVSVRLSGTEPVFRVFGEATTFEKAEKLCDETIGKLRQIIVENVEA